MSFQVASFPEVPRAKPYMHLSSIRATCPTHLILLDLISRIIFGENYRSVSSPVRRFLHSHVTPSLLSPNVLLTTLFSNTPSLRSSLNVSDQVLHPQREESISGKYCSRTFGRQAEKKAFVFVMLELQVPLSLQCF